ncbi:unnamed protein product [Heterobilharzia americana]|nr:unnamed protein product [Heterobilharzia americana]
MEHIKYSNSIEVIDNSLKCTLDNNNRINLQTLTEEFQTSSFCQTSQICHKNSQPLCVAVLPPPVQFTRAAVRRIARAILRKLHGQNKLPFSPSITSISTSSRQVITTMNRNNDDNHIESCTNFNSTPYTDNSKNIQYDKMNQVYRYELFHGSMATSIYRRKRSLIASSLYSELASSVKDTETSNEQQHHLSVGVNCSISSQESHSRLKPPTSDSPSALTSLISLDSYTGHLIARELNSLLLDKDTKLAIMNDIQRELSRPKYRPDFFYAGNKHKLPLCHVPEYTTFKQFPCDVNYTTKELKFNQTHLFNSNSKKSPTNVLQKGLSIEGVIGLSMNKSVTLLDPQKTALINAYHHHYHHQQQKKGISDIKNLMNSPKTNELFAYLTDMLDSRILQSFTFIILSIACFINMFVLLVPFHYLPLLLDYGGLECHFNSLWCPNGLMDIDNNNNIDNNKKVNRTHDQDVLMTSYNNELSVSAVNFVGKNYAFASSELLLLTIGCASLLGRLFAGLLVSGGNTMHGRGHHSLSEVIWKHRLRWLGHVLCTSL